MEQATKSKLILNSDENDICMHYHAECVGEPDKVNCWISGACLGICPFLGAGYEEREKTNVR